MHNIGGTVGHERKARQGLIVVPSRELALQVMAEAINLQGAGMYIEYYIYVFIVVPSLCIYSLLCPLANLPCKWWRKLSIYRWQVCDMCVCVTWRGRSRFVWGRHPGGRYPYSTFWISNPFLLWLVPITVRLPSWKCTWGYETQEPYTSKAVNATHAWTPWLFCFCLFSIVLHFFLFSFWVSTCSVQTLSSTNIRTRFHLHPHTHSQI